ELLQTVEANNGWPITIGNAVAMMKKSFTPHGLVEEVLQLPTTMEESEDYELSNVSLQAPRYYATNQSKRLMFFWGRELSEWEAQTGIAAESFFGRTDPSFL